MVSSAKALIGSILLALASGAWAATPCNCDADRAAAAARSDLAGGIVVGPIIFATVLVAAVGGNDGLDTIAAIPPIVPPVVTTTATTTTTRTTPGTSTSTAVVSFRPA